MPSAMNLTPAHTSAEGARHCPPATSACRALPVGDGPRSYSSCVFSLPGSTPPLPLNQQQEKVAEAPNSRSGSDDNLSEMLCAMRQASADRSFASATKDALSDEQITRDEAIALLRSHGFPEGRIEKVLKKLDEHGRDLPAEVYESNKAADRLVELAQTSRLNCVSSPRRQ